ncbi:arylsulfatase [Fuerstiella marisgermanici]|uniref:Arylsulfatase n=1 Tax=Fuerstiella marisgermanici TaxID=1891926 RepID=A0A1P8WPU1_9PLAN|nr:arylsulfatase [Fuerstiella marisgermanici]APZ96079.1 Arylsulfatase precursor [Fuerstiella marisgermanici]
MSFLTRIAVLFLLLAAAAANAADKPNVVIVITDDQGYGDLSCHGNPILKTPAIDKLHGESVRLKDYHVSPTCSPTRSAFLTGHWTNRTGVWHTIMGRSMLRENEVTMGQVFKDAGYATGMFGKWHLGDNYPYRPEDRGYTEVLRHGGGGVGQTPDYWDNAYFDGSYWHNGTPESVKGFCTDVFFDYAKTFIKSSKEANKPFLAYIATNAPHGPMHAPEESSSPYKDVGNVGLQNFFGMIANIDDNVGKLRTFLDEQGLTENTIFIFTTDNGSSSGWRTFNAGMRAGKGSEYDGGHRVPFFAHWPKGKLTGGHDVEPITAHVDILPTLIDLCEIAPPEGVKFDGRSIAPLLDPTTGTDWPDRILVTDSQRVKDPIKWRKSSVMTSQWRLINGKQLYNIKADPGQKSDVASGHPDVVARLTEFYDAWWEDLLPSFSNDTAIYLGHPNDNPARLTSHDWITTGSTPWNQQHIRKAMNGDRNTGFWNVLVHEAGDYEIRLRRWPETADKPLNASLPPGADVPGVKAYRTQPGKAIQPVKASIKVGKVSAKADIQPGDREVVFNLTLPQGKTRMTALFTTADGEEFGPYYAYVQKK